MRSFQAWELAALAVFVATEGSAKKVAPDPKNMTAKKEVAPVEYDFRGAKLGMLLQDFRSLPFPDSYKRSARALCTNDAERATNGVFLYVNDYEKAAGVVKCGYFEVGTILKDWWRDTQVSVGTSGFASSDLRYSFVADPIDGVLKLYSISLTTNSNAEQSAVEGLSEKFGPPTLRINDTVQNRMGASFPRTTTTWANSLSAILVESPSFKIDEMTILYTENRLADIVMKKKEQIRGPASSKM